MDTVNGKALGVTFYCPTDEIFKTVAEIRDRLEAAGIATMWSTRNYEDRKVTSLDVYENANVVAQYLPAANY